MTSISNLTVALSANPNGGYIAEFSDGLGFTFDIQEFRQFINTADRRATFFFQAIQAFINNGKNPDTMTLQQIKTLLEAQTYVGIVP